MNDPLRTPGFGKPVLALMVLAFASGACKKSEVAATSETKPGDAPVHVQTQAVKTAAVATGISLTGSLRGERESDLAANAAGRVIATLVERGSDVKEGQVIARLDVRAAALSAQEAQVSAELAKEQAAVATRECARYETLVATGAISKLEYDRLKDTCKTSSISVQSANAHAAVVSQAVGDGIIRAPFSGTVAERYVNVGEYVRQDSKVISLVTLDKLRLLFTVPEASITRVKSGSEIKFQVSSYGERTFTGKVRYIGASVRETTRDLVVEATVDNADRTLRPGMFASVHLFAGEETLPIIPKSAVTEKDGLSHVFVVNQGRAEERVVQLGRPLEDNVAVVLGLKAGDSLVIQVPPTLRNGQPVN